MNATVSSFSLDHLSNDDLLTSMRAQVGRSNQVLAGLLAHLAEVDARGLFRLRACSSLCTYCVYELRLSEDAAQRRAQAAKIARRFPIVFEHIAAGELHLTGVLMLGPLLTETNHLEVLAQAKHRTKRELAGLLLTLDPLPDVPARIEPLGPAPESRPLQSGNHAQFAAALAGPVRDLPLGDRPSDWLGDGSDEAASAEPVPAPNLAETAAEQPSGEERLAENERLLAPQRYKVQFTASQEYVDLLEQAQDLLAPAVPRRNLEQVHLRALELLVAELKKRKYAITERSRSAAASSAQSKDRPAPARAPSQVPSATERAVRPRQRSKARSASAGPKASRTAGEPANRTIPAAVRRAVAERDQYRCTYVDDRGHRCRETSGLELHHEHAYALGGPATIANIALRCRAHNALAAEQDYGREFMTSVSARAPAPARNF